MLLRILLILLAAVAWLLLAWLAGHQSDNPAVLGRYSASYGLALAGLLLAALILSASTFGPTYAWLSRARAGILLSVGSTLLCLLVLELGIRWLDPLGISYYEESRRYHLDKLADDDLIYRHRAYIDSEYQDVRVRTNSLALRDEEILSPSGSTGRILLLGDSVAFGWGVAEEDIFASRLERRLSEKMGEPVEVINSGVGSYETTQQLKFSRKYAEQLNPDAVVLLYVSNDININATPFDPWSAVQLSGKPPPTALQIAAWESWLFRLVSHVLRMANAGPPRPNRQAPGWQKSMQSITELSALWTRRETPFSVVLGRKRATPDTEALLADLSALGRARGFPVGDTLSAFDGKPLRELTNSVVDAHPNAEGHALITSYLERWLEDEGVLRKLR